MSEHRPIYESAHDRATEAAVAAFLATKWGCRAVKQPRAYALDYALLRGDAVAALMEVKVRPGYDWGLFERGGYRISAHKWLSAKTYAGLFGVPFILAVEAGGDLRYAAMRAEADWTPDAFVWAGRADRGDWQDMEPHAVLYGNRFRKVAR